MRELNYKKGAQNDIYTNWNGPVLDACACLYIGLNVFVLLTLGSLMKFSFEMKQTPPLDAVPNEVSRLGPAAPFFETQIDRIINLYTSEIVSPAIHHRFTNTLAMLVSDHCNRMEVITKEDVQRILSTRGAELGISSTHQMGDTFPSAIAGVLEIVRKELRRATVNQFSL